MNTYYGDYYYWPLHDNTPSDLGNALQAAMDEPGGHQMYISAQSSDPSGKGVYRR
jgi:hypothetical protein